MFVARTVPKLAEFQAELAASRRPICLVPTMGALHDGHKALFAAARARGGATAVSIFVNPLQFGASEDYASYPRDEAADLAILEAAGCDLAWLPAPEAMYPPDSASEIEVAGPALGWEGAARPGHFRGVATVVAKLFGQVRPRSAIFGEKDWQQLQVVRRMTEDLHLEVEIIAVPTVRAADGLALSSRNQFLTAEGRERAPLLHATLDRVSRELAAGGPLAECLAQGAAFLGRSGFAVAYLALVDAISLVPLKTLRPPARLIAAAHLGAVRLIDNVAVA